jgi:hypothetical protein
MLGSFSGLQVWLSKPTLVAAFSQHPTQPRRRGGAWAPARVRGEPAGSPAAAANCTTVCRYCPRGVVASRAVSRGQAARRPCAVVRHARPTTTWRRQDDDRDQGHPEWRRGGGGGGYREGRDAEAASSWGGRSDHGLLPGAWFWRSAYYGSTTAPAPGPHPRAPVAEPRANVCKTTATSASSRRVFVL